MELKNGENRSSKDRESSNISHPETKPRFLGTASGTSSQHGSYSISIGRENSDTANILIANGESIRGVAGKIIRQLIEETEKQLAYHKEQVETLENRLRELNQSLEINAEA